MGDIRRRAAVVLGVTGLVAPLAVALGAAPGPGGHLHHADRPLSEAGGEVPRPQVDGRQSAADCRAIRAFQTKHGITPNIGYAGPVTWGVMGLMTKQKAAGKNPNKAGKCPTNKGRIACVDLTLQLSWIQDGNDPRVRAGAGPHGPQRLRDPHRRRRRSTGAT